MNDKPIDYYVKEGFNRVKDTYWTVLVNSLIMVTISFVLIATVIGMVALHSVYASFYKYMLDLSRGAEPKIGWDFAYGFKDGMFFKSLGWGCLFWGAVLIGLTVFVVPGLFLMTIWYFGFFLIVDNKTGVGDAFGKSNELVQKAGFWKVFVLTTLVFTVLNFVIEPTIWGIGTLVVIAAIPITEMIAIVLYRDAMDDLDVVAQDTAEVEEVVPESGTE